MYLLRSLQGESHLTVLEDLDKFHFRNKKTCGGLSGQHMLD